MASKAVSDAIEARLGSTWTGSDGVTLKVLGLNSNADDRPANGDPFIEVTYPVANEEWFTIGSPGSNTFKESGAFRIVLNEQRAVGMARAQAWIDTLRVLFRGVLLLDGALQCFAAPSAVVNDSNDLGSYYQFSFAVPYRYFFQG